MYVTDVEGCTVTGKTAGTECRKTALVSQLGKGVSLVHELRKLRRSEELADNGCNGSDVDKSLGSKLLIIMSGHSLADDLFHTGEADSDLVLKLFAYGTDTTVAEMVDIVGGSNIVSEVKQIVDGCKNILAGDVLGAKLVDASGTSRLDSIKVASALFHNRKKNGSGNLLANAAIEKLVADDLFGPAGVVREYLDNFAVVKIDRNLVYCRVFDLESFLGSYNVAFLEEELAADGANYGRSKTAVCDSLGDSKLLVELVTSNGSDVVSLCIKEEVVDKGKSRIDLNRLTGTELTEDLAEGLNRCGRVAVDRRRLRLVLFKSCAETDIVTEHFKDILCAFNARNHITGFGVYRKSEGADKHCKRELTVFIYSYINDVVAVYLILKPCAAVRYDLCSKRLLARLVYVRSIVHTGRTNDLRDDDTLCTVDNEGAVFSHDREVTHINIGLLDFSRLLVIETNVDLQGSGVVNVSFLAFLNRIFGLGIYRIGNEFDRKITAVIDYRRYVAENLSQSLIKEPLKGIGLNLNKIRDFECSAGFGKGFS